MSASFSCKKLSMFLLMFLDQDLKVLQNFSMIRNIEVVPDCSRYQNQWGNGYHQDDQNHVSGQRSVVTI